MLSEIVSKREAAELKLIFLNFLKVALSLSIVLFIVYWMLRPNTTEWSTRVYSDGQVLEQKVCNRRCSYWLSIGATAFTCRPSFFDGRHYKYGCPAELFYPHVVYAELAFFNSKTPTLVKASVNGAVIYSQSYDQIINEFDWQFFKLVLLVPATMLIALLGVYYDVFIRPKSSYIPAR